MKYFIFIFLIMFFILIINRLGVLDYLNINKSTTVVNKEKDIGEKEILVGLLTTKDVIRFSKLKSSIMDTTIIFDGKIYQRIPDEYGANIFQVKFNNKWIQCGGFFKKHTWTKFDYNVNVKNEKDVVRIDWELIFRDYENFGEKQIYTGSCHVSNE